MIRIICYEDSLADVVYGGASSAPRQYKTFDVELPDVEAWLRGATKYQPRFVCGIEGFETKEREG